MMTREDCFRLMAVQYDVGPEGAYRIAVPPNVTDAQKKEIQSYFGATTLEFITKEPRWINAQINLIMPLNGVGETEPEKILRRIIQTARRLRATDVILEPFNRPNLRVYKEFADTEDLPSTPPGRVRFNKEGFFDEYIDEHGRPVAFFQSAEEYDRTIRVIKSRAKSIQGDNDRKPIDGQVEVDYDGQKSSYRLNIIPLFGNRQKVVLRYTGSVAEVRSLSDLSFPKIYDPILTAARRRGEFIIFAGPTHSGKTTAAYSILTSLPREEMNIYTIEQPVECSIPLISQIDIPDSKASQVDQATVMSANEAMESLVRQNPDLVFLGEMRSKENVHDAFKMALAGSTVLTTVHTDRAKKVFERILFLANIEPERAQSIITMIVAQRLVRRVCRAPGCAVPLVGNEVEASPGGCRACNCRGYSGLIAILDIYRRHPKTGIWAYITTMENAAKKAIALGITDRAEVNRILGKDENEWGADTASTDTEGMTEQVA